MVREEIPQDSDEFSINIKSWTKKIEPTEDWI